jgi:hypothetical protein
MSRTPISSFINPDPACGPAIILEPARIASRCRIRRAFCDGWGTALTRLCRGCLAPRFALNFPYRKPLFVPRHGPRSPKSDENYSSIILVGLSPIHRITMHVAQLLHAFLVTPDIGIIKARLPDVLCFEGKLELSLARRRRPREAVPRWLIAIPHHEDAGVVTSTPIPTQALTHVEWNRLLGTIL